MEDYDYLGNEYLVKSISVTAQPILRPMIDQLDSLKAIVAKNLESQDLCVPIDLAGARREETAQVNTVELAAALITVPFTNIIPENKSDCQNIRN